MRGQVRDRPTARVGSGALPIVGEGETSDGDDSLCAVWAGGGADGTSADRRQNRRVDSGEYLPRLLGRVAGAVRRGHQSLWAGAGRPGASGAAQPDHEGVPEAAGGLGRRCSVFGVRSDPKTEHRTPNTEYPSPIPRFGLEARGGWLP